MTVAEYVDWWRNRRHGEDEQLLYLKDWHFVNEFPNYKVALNFLARITLCLLCAASPASFQDFP
jgi:hypothetical protein